MSEHTSHHSHPIRSVDPCPASDAEVDPTHHTPMASGPSGSSTRTGDGGVWTEQRIRALGAVTDLPTTGRIFGLGRSLAYDLARNGDFPVPVIRVGARYRVPVAAILAALHLWAASDLTSPAGRSMDHHDAISSIDAQRVDPNHPRGEP
jgi:hypothetical protein